MTTPEQIRENLGCLPAETERRWMRLVGDSIAHKYFAELQAADDWDKSALEAQLETYLAAAHAIFPQEVKVVYVASEMNSDV